MYAEHENILKDFSKYKTSELKLDYVYATTRSLRIFLVRFDLRQNDFI